MTMKFVIAVGAVLAVSACTPAGVTGAGVTEGPQRLSIGESVDIAAVGTRLTALRAGQGLGRPLAHSPALQAAAQAQADDMSRSGRLSHTGSNGSTLSSRVQATGFTACYAAENIAVGQDTTAEVFDAWMASPEHRTNILAPQATRFGYARSNGYSALVLGRSC